MNTLLQRMQDSEQDKLNTTYWLVRPIADAIKNGDEAELFRSIQPLIARFRNPNAQFTLSNIEFTFISLVNTFMIAAIQADVYPPFANWVADQSIERLIKNKNSNDLENILQEIAKDFCDLVIQENLQNDPQDSNRYVRKAKMFIKTHITQAISLDDIANNVGISKQYLCKVFKKYSHQTVNEFLSIERINTAKQLLQTTNYTISEIAAILQFCDQSYFAQAFKKITGTTPKSYRMHSNMIDL